jgi:hypothetical protein
MAHRQNYVIVLDILKLNTIFSISIHMRTVNDNNYNILQIFLWKLSIHNYYNVAGRRSLRMDR